MQPPPRGCVLKPFEMRQYHQWIVAAASARLCVETELGASLWESSVAAASARLCVETFYAERRITPTQQPPPRGCVLKLLVVSVYGLKKLAAASARLCVETGVGGWQSVARLGSRLRAAVC